MWWRFLTFCVLVSFVLFVVLSCIHGRPVIHLFFHRCCEDDIENDQVIFENFGNNFLRERLVGADIVVDDNDSFVSDLEVEEVIKAMRKKLNVHDPKDRLELDIFPVNENETSSELFLKVKELTKELESASELNYTPGKGENLTFNDLLGDSQEKNIPKVKSTNDLIKGLDSDENSAELTTENIGPKTKLFPIKLRNKQYQLSEKKENFTEKLSVK